MQTPMSLSLLVKDLAFISRSRVARCFYSNLI